MEARDIYLKTTTANGKSSITRHRVWNAEQFVKTQQEAGKKAGEKNKAEGYTVALSSEAEFKKQ